METSLHRALKQRYAGAHARTEVRLDGYRIDAVCDNLLVEIQHGSLAAIRDKVRRLLERHRVLVVKPIVARKTLVKLAAADGPVVSSRTSPKRGQLLDIFEELVYFTRVFPHPRLTLEVVLVEVEERRYPGHGRRRRWRRNDFVVGDQLLSAVGDRLRLRRAADLLRLLPADLPAPFHTGDLARAMQVQRHVAQRVAYCLREMQAVRQVGKQGNTIVYRVPARRLRRGKPAA
ncbi:MAG: hypothetical protein AB7O59_16615 [Pirellulales bacterium]